MTTQEFSDQFDLLWNNISSNQAPGLNEYEKSVFLTKAQSQLVKEFFNARIDGVGGGFDGSQKRQYDFSGLIRTANLYNVNTYANRISGFEKLDKRSEVFLMPWNYFLSVNEIIADNRWQYSVLPIDYAEYQRLMLKPYNYPVKRAAWRINTDKKNCNFWEKFVPTTDDFGDNIDSTVNYRFISTWGDEKRNLEIIIKQAPGDIGLIGVTESNPIIVTNHPTVARDTKCLIAYLSSVKGDSQHAVIDQGDRLYSRNIAILNRGWKNDFTYQIEIQVDNDIEKDADAFESIKDGFKALKQFCKNNRINLNTYDEGPYEDLIKACRHTDGFAQATAPKGKSNAVKQVRVANPTGLVITTTLMQLPFVEVIGKFKGEPTYQMRYVRTLEPIILENLTNYGEGLTIEGKQQVTECELPVECHEEILERAVTLAKITWAGGTSTQAQAASSRKDND